MVPGTVTKLSVRPESLQSRVLLTRGCRATLPSVWFTRCACPIRPGVVRFIFLFLCLCLVVSRGRIMGECRSKPLGTEAVTWPALSLVGWFSGRHFRGRYAVKVSIDRQSTELPLGVHARLPKAYALREELGGHRDGARNEQDRAERAKCIVRGEEQV
jgi:hypothetical protein